MFWTAGLDETPGFALQKINFEKSSKGVKAAIARENIYSKNNCAFKQLG